MKVIGCDNYPKQKAAWERFGKLIGAAKIEYNDRGKGETYTIILESGEEIKLTADGNTYDGGFANLYFPEDEFYSEIP